MISDETMAELEKRGVEYILGARERSDKEVREIVLADDKPMVAMTIPRARDKETTIAVKEVVVGDWGPGSHPRRYVVCLNPAEAKRDAAARAEILASLARKLEHGDKELVGNAGYRRFLATPGQGHFAIDPARVAADARFDGLYVLRTNAKLNTLSVALAYRQLWRVDIDQAWRLSRLCGGMMRGKRGREAAPRRRRCANRLELRNGRRVGVHQFDGITANQHLAAA